MALTRKKVAIVPADGSGLKMVDFSTAALNELRANQEPEDFAPGQSRLRYLPEYVGNIEPESPGQTSVNPVVQSTHPYQDGGV